MFTSSSVTVRARAREQPARPVSPQRRLIIDKSAQIDSPTHPICRNGKPVDFNWTLSQSLGLTRDARKYESEARRLFDSPETDWVELQTDYGKLLLREAAGASPPGPLSQYVVDLMHPHGARSLFKFLVSEEGFRLIDPNSDLESSRSNPCQRFDYQGIQGYTCAPVTTFQSMGGLQMVCPNAVWFDDEIFLNWPCDIPQDLRPPASREITREYTMVYAIRVLDIAPGKVRLQQLMWLSFLQGEQGEQGHKAFVEGLYSRLTARLAKGDVVMA